VIAKDVMQMTKRRSVFYLWSWRFSHWNDERGQRSIDSGSCL